MRSIATSPFDSLSGPVGEIGEIGPSRPVEKKGCGRGELGEDQYSSPAGPSNSAGWPNTVVPSAWTSNWRVSTFAGSWSYEKSGPAGTR